MSSIKKRRVDKKDAGLPAVAAGEELTEIKTTINKMMNHQMESMSSMMKMMHSMQGEMKHMQDTITQLTEKCEQMQSKCDNMNTSMKTMQTTMLSRFDKVDDRFDKSEDKQKYHEVQLTNQKWEYSAPHPSDEYWHSLGIREAEEADRFLQQIKKETKDMRYGIDYVDSDVDHTLSIEINASLPYNAQFLPHWEEFANALKQYQYFLKCFPLKSSLALWSMELPDAVIDLLSKALEFTHFGDFVLCDNSFGQKGIDFALKYLQNNNILKDFSLYENKLGMHDIQRLCDIVAEHPSIEILMLEECQGESVDGYEMLQTIMSAGRDKLKTINLSKNDICTDGDTFLSDFIAKNHVLKSLDLSGNQLGDNCAMAIASSLKHNKTLRSLNIRLNNLSNAGWKALRKAEFDDTSLNSAADSNHTCYICYPEEYDYDDDGDDDLLEGLELTEMNGNAEVEHSLEAPFFTGFVRQKKIYSILSSWNRTCSNVDHFEDIPVEFLPSMLESIQQYANYHVPDRTPSQDIRDVKPLSIMFEVLQRWDKSLATFEALSS